MRLCGEASVVGCITQLLDIRPRPGTSVCVLRTTLADYCTPSLTGNQRGRTLVVMVWARPALRGFRHFPWVGGSSHVAILG